MDDMQAKDTDVVLFAWYLTARNGNDVLWYNSPKVAGQRTHSGLSPVQLALRHMAEEGRLTNPERGLSPLTWDGAWLPMELLPNGDAKPSGLYFDGFAPVLHPATKEMMAVLLRKRQ
jgi:hypothetical protein